MLCLLKRSLGDVTGLRDSGDMQLIRKAIVKMLREKGREEEGEEEEEEEQEEEEEEEEEKKQVTLC